MSSLYAQYLCERTNDFIIETDEGFASYRYLDDGKTVYLVDIFVVPAKRREGVAARLANDVAKTARAMGCNKMIGSVVPSMRYSTISMKVLLGYGMSLQSASNDFIVFQKEI